MTTSRSDGPMSITAIRVEGKPVNRGEFQYYMAPPQFKKHEIAGLTFICPCGCGGRGTLRFDTIYATGWSWDGNVDKPTVVPSVKQLDCGWHGYLRHGRWETKK